MEKLYNIIDVCEVTTLGKSTLLKLVYENKFPKPFKISGRRMAWYQKDVNEWIKNKKVSRGYEEDAFGNVNNN